MSSVRIIREGAEDYRIHMEPAKGQTIHERADNVEEATEKAGRFLDPEFYTDFDLAVEGMPDWVDEPSDSENLLGELGVMLESDDVMAAVRELKEVIGRLEDDLTNAHHEGMEQARREITELAEVDDSNDEG